MGREAPSIHRSVRNLNGRAEVHLARRQTGGGRNLEEFISQVANSFVKIELIKFFYHNPHFLGKAADISIAIGRDPKKVSKGIDDLVRQGIIEKSGRQGAAIWSYKPEESIHRKVTRFIEAYEGPDLRQWIVNQVIRGEE